MLNLNSSLKWCHETDVKKRRLRWPEFDSHCGFMYCIGPSIDSPTPTVYFSVPVMSLIWVLIIFGISCYVHVEKPVYSRPCTRDKNQRPSLWLLHLIRADICDVYILQHKLWQCLNRGKTRTQWVISGLALNANNQHPGTCSPQTALSRLNYH